MSRWVKELDSDCAWYLGSSLAIYSPVHARGEASRRGIHATPAKGYSCSLGVLWLHTSSSVFGVLPPGRLRYWIDFTSPLRSPLLSFSPSTVLSEFMVMVSNDVPSTLGNLGSLRDGRPALPCLLHLPRGKAVSRIHTGAAGSCRSERQKVKPKKCIPPASASAPSRPN